MNVFLLVSTRKQNGNEPVTQIDGVFSSLRKAQSALVSSIDLDLQYGGFDQIKGDGDRPVEDYDIHELARMFDDDPLFNFDVHNVSLWTGEEKSSSPDSVTYVIVERQVV